MKATVSVLSTLTLVLVILAAAVPESAFGQAYPERPIRYIVPYAAGGGTDVMARLLAKKLTEDWGHPVVVENVAGAGSTIGSTVVAKARPDGYTILMGATPHAMNLHLYTQLSYDTINDFTAVSQVSSAPYVLMVNNEVPAESINDLIALAKSKPGQLNYASVGAGSGPHLGMELFKMTTGVDIVHIPFKGAAPAITEMLAGRVHMYLDVLPSALSYSKSGRLRALGVTSATRSPLAPDIPTFAESGLSGFELTSWMGVYAPAGTPKAIVTKLSNEIAKILNMPDVKERMFELGNEPMGSSPQQFTKFTSDEIVKWGKLVKSTGARIE